MQVRYWLREIILKFTTNIHTDKKNDTRNDFKSIRLLFN